LATKFAGQIRADLADRFLSPLNVRYRAGFTVGEVSLVHSTTRVEPQKRWLSYATDNGTVWIALSRELLLCILRYRYGTYQARPTAAPGGAPSQDPAPAPAVAVALEPESATEDRLAAVLAAQLQGIVTGRIAALPDSAGAAPAKAPAGGAEVCTSVPIDDTWTLRAQINESACGLSGTFWVVLDERWMTRLLKGLAPTGGRPAARQGEGAVLPLPGRLHLTLVARLLEKEVPLGTVMDWSVGDVMAITLGPTDVLIGSSRLFTASVAETGGKMCLTSFKDVE
jgi:flagellar motor switch protein FliM